MKLNFLKALYTYFYEKLLNMIFILVLILYDIPLIKRLFSWKIEQCMIFIVENIVPCNALQSIATQCWKFRACSTEKAPKKSTVDENLWKCVKTRIIRALRRQTGIDMINDAHTLLLLVAHKHTVYGAHNEILLLLVKRTLSKHNRLPTIQYSSRA